MIATVSFNPCMDRTVYIDELCPGTTHRLRSERLDPGSKGVNVSAVLANFGIESECFIYSHADGGRKMLQFLDTLGIAHSEVEVPGSLRLNTKIMESSGRMTELNQSGFPIAPEYAEKMLSLICGELPRFEIAVLSGSVSPGVDSEIYAKIIAQSNFLGVKTILDADGELMKNGISALPFAIKPNISELEHLVGRSLETPQQVAKAAARLAEDIPYVFVSMGKDGALAAGEGGVYYAKPIDVEVKCAAAAGDSMVAGICRAVIDGGGIEQMLLYGTAAASGTVSREGTQVCTAEDFNTLVPKAVVFKM